MKTYDEYYKISKHHQEDSLATSESMYGKKWWRNNRANLEPTQEYNFIKPINDKNDAPIVKNVTNVLNSKWCILHNMLSEMVIDYLIENKIDDDIYTYSININFDKPHRKWTIYLKRCDNEYISLPESEPFDFPSFEFVSDENIIKKFDSLNRNVYKCVKKFIDSNRDDIPIITNNVNFSIDNVDYSLKQGELMPSSEASLSVGWDRTGDENADELLVVSM